MVDEYYSSEETYKGFTLKVKRFRLSDRMIYHRCCDIFKDGVRVGVSKTKKEAKDLIAGGYIREKGRV